jgi:hypothetical protein
MSKETKVLPILMFCALPASGKSESRRFFKSLTPEEMSQFHLGDSSTQVDDYPYVYALEKIDVFCKETLDTTIFKDPNTRLFLNGYEWGVLTYLINEDYLDLKKLDKKIPEEFEKDPVKWLFDRYDAASEKTGKVPRRFEELEKKSDKTKFAEFKKKCFDLCKTLLHDKYDNIPESLEGKTIIFEFSRGGEKGSSFPLPAPYGYQYTLSLFDDEILNNANILYIWVTPEQSFNKNKQRALEGLQGKSQTVSTQLSLNHGVPDTVMNHEYGVDDFEYLISQSKDGKYVPIIKNGKEFKVKAGRLDNRTDLTSDFRKPQKDWTKEQIDNMTQAMKKAFDALICDKTE